MEVLSDLRKAARSAFARVYLLSADGTAETGDEIWVDSSGGPVTVTLPAGPSAGDAVEVYREGESDVTIARNGSTIRGAAENLVLDVDSYGVRLRYLGSTWTVELRTLAQ